MALRWRIGGGSSIGPRFQGATERAEAVTLADTESEMEYVFRFKGRSSEEGHLRSLLVGMTERTALVLRALTSEDINGSGLIEVRAELLSQGRQDRVLEQIVNRLSLEPSVTAVAWEVGRSSHDRE